MRFVIIGSARTGSSHLVNMLSGHPEILCNGNIFHPWTAWVFWPDVTPQIRDELLELRNSDPTEFLERVFLANYGRQHVGFKIFEGQNDEIIEKMIDDSSVRKIVLYRKNVLANYSSALIARRTGKHGQKEGHERPPAPKVRFSEQKFIEFHNDYIRFYCKIIDRLNSRRENFYLTNYEEINDSKLLAALINFIGADATRTISAEEQHKRQVKQNSSDILSRFANPDEVEKFLEKRGLSHWSYEGETSLSEFPTDSVEVANSFG